MTNAAGSTLTRRVIAPVDGVGFATAPGDRDAAGVPARNGVPCDLDAAAIEPDLACDPAEADDPAAACRERLPGAEPGRSAAPVRPRLPVTGRRVGPDRGVDAPVADGAEAWDAVPWDAEFDEPCRDEDDGEEPSGVFTGAVTV